MAIQSQPSRIPEPFAGSGTKNTIPATNATPSASQAASWASGFPPECSQPISAGGCPVPRNDVNGALNQLSQDFAYRQDGGVWEWSALADYDSQRLVRGSDGLLYYSVQPSGAGLASGAVDPTADDGTYWSAPKGPTVSPSDSSKFIATTEWVNQWYSGQLLSTDFYISPTGDDSNRGTSPDQPFQTLAPLQTLVQSTLFPLPNAINVHFEAGVYSYSLGALGRGTTASYYGPESGVASFPSATITASQSLTSFLNRFQFSGRFSVNRGAIVLFTNGLYINFDNLGTITDSIVVYNTGSITMYNSSAATIAYTGTNNWTNGCLRVYNSASVAFGNLTVTGTATGKRYNVGTCSGVSGAGSATLFPGSVNGTVDSTSYYM